MALCILLVLALVVLVIDNRNTWAERDATFLAQCHDAGYDVAKCRFFLTAMSRANSAAATQQMMIEAATPK